MFSHLDATLLLFIFRGSVPFSMFSNVAYRRPVYKTGVVPHKKNLFEKLTFFSPYSITQSPHCCPLIYTQCVIFCQIVL